jgi:hypothetical protein
VKKSEPNDKSPDKSNKGTSDKDENGVKRLRLRSSYRLR